MAHFGELKFYYYFYLFIHIIGEGCLCQLMAVTHFTSYLIGKSQNGGLKMALFGLRKKYATNMIFVPGLCMNIDKVGGKLYG